MTSLTRTEQQIPPAPHPTELGGVRVAVEIKGQGVIIAEGCRSLWVPGASGDFQQRAPLTLSSNRKESLGQEGLFVCSCVCAPRLPWQAELAVCFVEQRTGLVRRVSGGVGRGEVVPDRVPLSSNKL